MPSAVTRLRAVFPFFIVSHAVARTLLDFGSGSPDSCSCSFFIDNYGRESGWSVDSQNGGVCCKQGFKCCAGGATCDASSGSGCSPPPDKPPPYGWLAGPVMGLPFVILALYRFRSSFSHEKSLRDNIVCFHTSYQAYRTKAEAEQQARIASGQARQPGCCDAIVGGCIVGALTLTFVIGYYTVSGSFYALFCMVAKGWHAACGKRMAEAKTPVAAPDAAPRAAVAMPVAVQLNPLVAPAPGESKVVISTLNVQVPSPSTTVK